jgi:crotonobetainyl-CoA:carnitine CoA-transferase CaiB-like acyl-CoA transferase
MRSDTAAELIDQAWAAVAADASTASPELPAPVELSSEGGHLPSHLPVEDTAVACVAAALLANAALHRQRGATVRGVSLDRGHVAAAVRSERYFRRGEESAGAGFAPLSRFWRSADGWVRTHGNYPWHRAALAAALRTPEDVEGIGAAIAALPSEDVEDLVCAAGGIAAAVRSLVEWRAHPQGRAVASEPLVGHQVIGEAPPRRRPRAEFPASEVRVLDLTRVIAGPVCTRFLAAGGSDVLRIDPPQRPDMRAGAAADTLLGKRSAVVDLRTTTGAETLHRLLVEADAVVCGYRPGALDRFGLDPHVLAERHPGLVVVYLDAWGHSGPWADRRGFDSVVQAPTGIALAESTDGIEPGALPCQLLDHGTGYLAAAAALDGLRRQADIGGTHIRRLSLARTAGWLTTSATSAPSGTAPPAPRNRATAEATAPAPDPDLTLDRPAWLVDLDCAQGPVRAVAPPGAIAGVPLRWRRPLTGYGGDAPTWS